MKTRILVLILIINFPYVYSQQWINNYDFQISNPGYTVVQMQFLNVYTGWVSLRSGANIRILKSTNRGSAWFQINSYDMYAYSNSKPYFIFRNENTGYRAHTIYDTYGLRTILDKTINGGLTWNRKIDYIQYLEGELPLIMFKNDNEGYLIFADTYYGMNEIKAYKTTNGFENSTNDYTWNTVYKRNFKLNSIFIDNNQNINAVGWNKYSELNTQDFLVCGKGQDYFRSYGPANPNTNLHFMYGATRGSNIGFIGVENHPLNNYPGARFYFDYYPENSVLIDPQTSDIAVGGLCFSDNSKGFTTIGNKVYVTTNSGYNWQQETTLASNVYSSFSHSRLESIGDVCYAVSSPGFFHTRKISGYYNTNFDWQTGLSGSIAVDGENIGTPSTGFYRGGNVALYANKYLNNPALNTEACFYYWGGNCSGSMNNSSGSYLINSGSQINADYKTKMYSQDINSIRGAVQTKVIKDTAINGLSTIHLINQGMGGIFYTKSTDNGNTFKSEEVVNFNSLRNDYSGNKNACMNIIRIQNKPVTVSDPERNVAVAWERYNSNTGYNEIKAAIRWLNPNQEPYWSTYNDYNGGVFTSFMANNDFESKPKIFVREVGELNNSYTYLYLVPHLRPDGNQTKLVVTLRYKDYNIDYLIDNGNISDLAVTSPFNLNTGMFPLHFVYKKDNQIKYKYAEIGTYVWGVGEATPYYQAYPSLDYIVSNNTSMLTRNAPDITLRNISNNPNASNLQPVVSYQAQYLTKVFIENEDGPVQIVNTNYYPIIVRERILSTNGGFQWSPQNIQYNSVSTQQNPGIEGSKNKNSYVLTYSKSNKVQMVQVPNWEGNNGFYCTWNNIVVNDAKLVEGSMYNSIANQQINSLEPYSGIYKVNKNDFTISNEINIENPFDGVSGTLIEDNIQYSFNLGSILVNNSPVNFNIQLDTVIENYDGFNDFMTSNTFTLNENDTLIIGRNANYVFTDSSGIFLGIEYWVNLVNVNTSETHRVLAHDT